MARYDFLEASHAILNNDVINSNFTQDMFW